VAAFGSEPAWTVRGVLPPLASTPALEASGLAPGLAAPSLALLLPSVAAADGTGSLRRAMKTSSSLMLSSSRRMLLTSEMSMKMTWEIIRAPCINGG